MSRVSRCSNITVQLRDEATGEARSLVDFFVRDVAAGEPLSLSSILSCSHRV